jgi:hypothetical protein
MLERQLDRLLAIARFADDVESLDTIEERLQRAPEERMVVCDQDRNLSRAIRAHGRDQITNPERTPQFAGLSPATPCASAPTGVRWTYLPARPAARPEGKQREPRFAQQGRLLKDPG